MPLFAPLSHAERQALRASPASAIPQRLAALLQQHHTRVSDLFRALDKNADGEVSRAELAEGLSSLGVQASREELDALFDRLDPDRSGGIVFRELQLAMLAATREEGGAKKATEARSRPASRAASRPTSRSTSPRWKSYERDYYHVTAAAASSTTGTSGPGASGVGGALEGVGGEARYAGGELEPLEPLVATGASSGPASQAGGATAAELTLVEEIINVAVNDAAREGELGGDGGGVTLLRVLSAYEMVLQRHSILPIEDTHHYQLLLQLSLLPQHDWRDKLAAFRQQHRIAAATSNRLPMPTSPLHGGDYYSAAPPPPLPARGAGSDGESAYTHAEAAMLRAAAATLRATAASTAPATGSSAVTATAAATALPSSRAASAAASAAASTATSRNASRAASRATSRNASRAGSPLRSSHPALTPLAPFSPTSSLPTMLTPPGAAGGQSPSPTTHRHRHAGLAAPSPCAVGGSSSSGAPLPAATDATGQSDWLDTFLANTVGGLGVGSSGSANGGAGGALSAAAASASGEYGVGSEYGGSYTYAGNGRYVLSEVRLQATQMRAALRFDEARLSSNDAEAFDAFRQRADAFRWWRQAAADIKAEANSFRAAVSRWLMAVSFWETRLLRKCLIGWGALPGVVERAGEELHSRYRLRVLGSHLGAMVDSFRSRYIENTKLVEACAHFGAGSTRAHFTAWRNALLQAKAWWMRGEQAHLEHAWARLREGCSGAARAGHVWIRAAGVDDKKRVRACFTRLMCHAEAMVATQAALVYWRAAAIRACFLCLYTHSVEQMRTLRLLRGALSHHAGVLLQAVFREWFIAIRHEMLARDAWRRASLAASLHRWSVIHVQLAALEGVAMSFVLTSETATMRAVLRDWRLDCKRAHAKRAKVGTAVAFAWMSLTRFVVEQWKVLVRAAREERRGAEKAARMWRDVSLSRGWTTWLAHAEEHARYLYVASQIASSSDAGLRGLVWGAWSQLHRSSISLRASLLAEHALAVTRRWLRRLERACATSRSQKLALRQLAGSCASRVLQMHFGAWNELKTTRRRLDATSRLHLGRLMHTQLAGGLLTWLAHVEEAARQTAMMELCVRRFVHAEASRALTQWREVAEESVRAREGMRRALYRLENQQSSRAFSTWAALAAERERKRSLLRGALGRIRNRLLSLVYDGWIAYVARRQEVDGLLRGASMRLMLRLEGMVFGAWLEYVGAKRRCRVIAAQIEGSHELGQLASGLAQWRRRSEAAAVAARQTRRSLAFFTNRLLVLAWNAWAAMLHQARDFRERALPVANRLLHKLQSMTFYAWVGLVGSIKDDRAKASRAALLWAGNLASKCFVAWDSYRQRRQRHARDNAEARYRNDVRLASRHLGAWCGKWEHIVHERSLMKRSVSFLTNSASMRCMNTWREYWHARNYLRGTLAAAYARWRNQELHAAFHFVRDVLDDERAAFAKASEVVSKLLNRALTKGFVTWSAFGSERAATLEAMRGVAETVVSRGKRAAFNTMVGVMEDGLKFVHARKMVVLREARGALLQWGGHGRARRKLITSLRRLTQRELTRGWMCWVGDWRATHDLLTAAHAKAQGFVGRALQYELARGWNSMRDAYDRVLQLRIMLRRVANPRACGMLRRWLKLVHRRNEQLRKLRSAYATIAYGTVKRVVVAWRGLCARRRVVKARVAALLGRMLDASFHAWSRYVRKRVAAAHAGSVVLEARRERVCSGWLLRWHYHAHLSSALAAGLRTYFMRSTFSIFSAWAAFTAEQLADRACESALADALADAGGESTAVGLFGRAGRRWRLWEEAAAFDVWEGHAHFASTAAVFTGLAVRHSAQALAQWAFREYAFAVRLVVEERAAGLFWEHARVQHGFSLWAHAMRRHKVVASKSASAVFHFFDRLLNLVFLRWREMSRHWRNRRLGKLAAQLHYEGSLTTKIFDAWSHHTKYVGWRFRQTQAGLMRHWVSLERNVFGAWSDLVAVRRGLRKLCDGKYLDAERRSQTLALKAWAARGGEIALAAQWLGRGRRATLRHAIRTWHEWQGFASMLILFAESSGVHLAVESKRSLLRRWSAFARLSALLDGVVDNISTKKRKDLLSWAVGRWNGNARGWLESMRCMEDSFDFFGTTSLRRCVQTWALRCKLSEETLRHVQLAMASHSNRLAAGGFEIWRRKAQARADNLRKMRRAYFAYAHSLVVRIVKGWARIVGQRQRREDICQGFLRKLLNRQVALAWRSLVLYLEHRRELKTALAELAFRTDRGSVRAAMHGWHAQMLEWRKFSHLRDTALSHHLAFLGGVVNLHWAHWRHLARVASVMAVAMGRTTLREVRGAFETLRVDAIRCRFLRAAGATSTTAAKEAIHHWRFSIWLQRTVASMFFLSMQRDAARAIRLWRDGASRRAACLLRERYMRARRQFNLRQSLLHGWRMHAAASQHARRADQLRVLSEMRLLCRYQGHRRRITVRALALWSNTLLFRVLKAWRLHTTMAREARYELVRARANQTALEGHRRRARARALSAIVTSWHVYAHAKARQRMLADEQASSKRRLYGFEAWRLRAASLSRSWIAADLAARHFRAHARSACFLRWAAAAGAYARRAGLLLVLLQRRAYSTRLAIVHAWRGLVRRTAKLIALHTRVGSRLALAVILAWRAAVVGAIEREEQAAVLHRRARQREAREALRRWGHAAATYARRRTAVMRQAALRMRGSVAEAFGRLQQHARRSTVVEILARRTSVGRRRLGLHKWHGQMVHARRQLRTAAAFAFDHRRVRIIQRWAGYVRGRRVRRLRIAGAVEERMLARGLGACGEVVRLWRAVTASERLGRRKVAGAFGTLRTLAALASGERARFHGALEYHRRRLAGVVFFHWRALSWSMNWEKPGRLSEDGYDLSEGLELFNERIATSRHSRVAAHLVRDSVVHQRRSTLAFQDTSTRQKEAAERVAAAAASPPRGSPPRGLGSPSSRRSSPAAFSASASPGGGRLGGGSASSSLHGTPLSAGGSRAKVHALSPTGLSVALVLGSQMVGDAPPDADLGLDAPFSTRSSRRRSALSSGGSSSRRAMFEEEEVAFESGDDSGGDGAQAGSVPASAAGALAAGAAGAAGSREASRTPRGVPQHTPATLTPSRQAGGGASGSGGGALGGAGSFLSLEEYAEMERRAAMRRSAGGGGSAR